MSKQKTRKFVTKILRKTCSSLVKNITDGEKFFIQISTISCKKSDKISVFYAKNSAKVQIWDHVQFNYMA